MKSKKGIQKEDKYSIDILKEQYELHKNYALKRLEASKKLNAKIRLPIIPEDISENIIKFIIHKNGDNSSNWFCQGDLISSKEGKQECKCFTTQAPCSFTNKSSWDVIYFLDACNWLQDEFKLYRVPLLRTSPEWENIQISKKEKFADQVSLRIRPRISWKNLYPQIQNHCQKIFDGPFENIFLEETTNLT